MADLTRDKVTVIERFDLKHEQRKHALVVKRCARIEGLRGLKLDGYTGNFDENTQRLRCDR